MKKIILVVMLIIVVVALSACNEDPFGTYAFYKVHICDFAGHCKDLDIISWTDSETGIEVKSKEYGSLFLSEGTYILYSDKCPICSNSNSSK